MSAAAEARQSELDRVLDAQSPTVVVADGLFAVADLLRVQAGLRGALADSTASEESRRALAEAVFPQRVTKAVASVVVQAAALRWNSGSRLVAAVERQGLRALFATALVKGSLDRVEEELFRFGRSVAADTELRAALDDRNAPAPVRQQLVSDLVGKKVDPITLKVLRRAVWTAQRGFELTLEEMLRLAAATRQRAIAVVTVAQPLTQEQEQRLQTVLVSKLGRQVNLQVVVDPNVLGGARVKVGDQVIEGTVAGRLAAAEQQLTQ